jgi:hypothetical protein
MATLRERLSADTTIPPLPALVAAGTPEEWLRRRPDIREAERRLAAATADVGIQVADYFPRVELLGSFGWTGGSRADLGSAAAERWSWGPSLTWRFLDLGRVRQRVRAASARAEGALAAYHETVLRALEETENALAGFRSANQTTAELAAAVAAAGETARLARLRHDAGMTDAGRPRRRTQPARPEDRHVGPGTACQRCGTVQSAGRESLERRASPLVHRQEAGDGRDVTASAPARCARRSASVRHDGRRQHELRARPGVTSGLRSV